MVRALPSSNPRSAHSFSLTRISPRYFTAPSENDKNKVAAFTQAWVIHTDAISRDADVVDVNLSPAVPFTMPRLRRENLFFSLLSV
jgi:hypothetical protein